MNSCKKCGAQLYGNVHFCPNCGTAVEKKWESSKEQKEPWVESLTDAFAKMGNTPDSTSEYEAKDIQENRVICFFAYLSWLVLVPILANPNSKYARFHSNQGLILLICSTIVSIAQWVVKYAANHISLLFSIGNIVLGVAQAGCVVLAIIGLVNVYRNRAKELPLIGFLRLLK